MTCDRQPPSPFSARPGLDYFLAISVPVALIWLLQLYQGYYCHTTAGLESSFCRYHDEWDVKTDGHHSATRALVFLLAPFLVPIIAAIYAPFFLLALFIARRLRIGRNMVGVAYWMVAWMLIGVSPVVASIIVAFIDEVIASFRYDYAMPGAKTVLRLAIARKGFATDLGAHGAITGMFYCILALTRRSRPSPA